MMKCQSGMNIIWRWNVKTMTKLILAILFMLIVISFYGLAEAKEPQSTMWARCVSDKAVVSCKLVDDKIFINGKEANVTKLDVIVIDNVVNVLIKDKQ